jgi:hypothetical protein
MNFHIDIVSQEIIAGWLTPDNPSVRAKLVLDIPDRNSIEIEANVVRPDILDLGWHATGEVGFSIDAGVVPDIADLDDLTLSDYHTGIAIYRRTPKETFLPGRLILFDCSLMPQWRIHAAIGQNFSVHYNSIDRFPLETTLALLWNSHLTSMFASGSPNYLRYVAALDVREFKSVALLRDPLEELAERLLFLKALAKMPADSNVRGMFANYEALLDQFNHVDFDTRKGLVSFLRGLEGRPKELLRSPMTRTFGAEVTDIVDRRKVPNALDNLAKMDLVGFRSDYASFSAIFDGLVGRKILSGSELSAIPGTAELAHRLRALGPATDLVEEDLALFEYATEAVEHLESGAA